jgi:hypothetical protein
MKQIFHVEIHGDGKITTGHIEEAIGSFLDNRYNGTYISLDVEET